MALVSPNAQFVNVITSEPSLTASSADLLSVIYTRVKKDSPDYNTVYEGIDQIVDVRFSTFVVHAAPEPIISLYDFIISTFVSDVNRPATNSPNSASSAEQPSTDESKIRVLVKLESIRGQFAALVHGLIERLTVGHSGADQRVPSPRHPVTINSRYGHTLAF